MPANEITLNVPAQIVLAVDVSADGTATVVCGDQRMAVDATHPLRLTLVPGGTHGGGNGDAGSTGGSWTSPYGSGGPDEHNGVTGLVRKSPIGGESRRDVDDTSRTHL